MSSTATTTITQQPPARVARYTDRPRPPRLIERNLPFEQSRNVVNVCHNQGLKIFKLIHLDLFHILLKQPTWISIGGLLMLWTIQIIVFACLYLWVENQWHDQNCALGNPGDPYNFAGTFAFSLETCTTVGYTLPANNNFFEKCYALQSLIFFQMVWSMMFNAFLFAFFYSRLARANLRSVQVVFSKKAIVSIDPISRQVRFQVRVYDVDAKYPVVEAHARLYCTTHDRPVPRPLRLLQPNDELNGMLFLSMPSVIHHHIDVYSLLHPPPPPLPSQSATVDPSITIGFPVRQADSDTQNCQRVECPVCGDTYATPEAWLRHARYQQIVEAKSDLIDGKDYNNTDDKSHLSLDSNNGQAIADVFEKWSTCLDLTKLQKYFRDEISEVICVVEGIDPSMSGTFQSLQSYRFEDIVFDEAAIFHPCLTIANRGKGGRQSKKNQQQQKAHSAEAQQQKQSSGEEEDEDDYFRVDLDRFHQIDRIDVKRLGLSVSHPVPPPPPPTTTSTTSSAPPTQTTTRVTFSTSAPPTPVIMSMADFAAAALAADDTTTTSSPPVGAVAGGTHQLGATAAAAVSVTTTTTTTVNVSGSGRQKMKSHRMADALFFEHESSSSRFSRLNMMGEGEEGDNLETEQEQQEQEQQKQSSKEHQHRRTHSQPPPTMGLLNN